MIITGKRHDFRIDYRVGFDATGRILGIEYEQAARCGMSIDLSFAIADRAMFHADNAYYLPAARITSYRCKTHTQSNTAFRGFGGPQGMVAMERVIDEIAHALGLDPLEVRRAILRPHGRQAGRARATSRPTTRPSRTASSRRSSTSWRRARTIAGGAQEIRAWNATSPILKRGIALTPVKFGISFTNTMLNQAGALVHVYNDGSIALNHGGTEMGQGLYTKVAQVVAEEFQVDIGRVKITATTTGKVPNTSATAASSGSDLNGMAARNAARGDQGAARRVPGRAPSGREERCGLPAQPHPHQGARDLLRRGRAARPTRAASISPPPASTPRPRSTGTAHRRRAGRSSTSPMARPCPRWRSTR